jgi:hypothetical protein
VKNEVEKVLNKLHELTGFSPQRKAGHLKDEKSEVPRLSNCSCKSKEKDYDWLVADFLLKSVNLAFTVLFSADLLVASN